MVAAKLATLEQGRPKNGKGTNLDLLNAAKKLNVARNTVQAARVVQRNGTAELIQAVEQGQLVVSAAKQICRIA